MGTQRSGWTIGVVAFALTLALAGALHVSTRAGMGSAAAAAPNAVPHSALLAVTTFDDKINDDGDCALREAVQAANLDMAVDACPAGSGTDTITLPAGVFVLDLVSADEDANATGDLDLLADLTLQGPQTGTAAIDGNRADRVLDVHADARVEVVNVTLTHGQTPDGAATGCGPGGAEPCPATGGGGVRNAGVLRLRNSVVIENRVGTGGSCPEEPDPDCAGTPGAPGGGVLNTGQLHLDGSRVISNVAGTGGDFWTATGPQGGSGGGIYNGQVMTLSRSLVAGNLSGIGGGNDATPPIYLVGPGGDGGGIYNESVLVIDETMVLDNQTVVGNGQGGGKSGDGGGIFNAGTLTVAHSTIARNHAEDAGWCPGFRCIGAPGSGGGIANAGNLLLSNSTVSDNAAGAGASERFGSSMVKGGDGGGILNTSGAQLHLENVTVYGNRAGRGPFDESPPEWTGAGGGLASAGQAEMKNTLLAGNITYGEGVDCSGEVFSNGYNLVETAEGCTIGGTTSGNHIGQAAGLAPLGDYGGPTWTHGLYKSSPAIDAGSCTDSRHVPVTRDQRGELRPQLQNCDIGAYEAGLDDPFHYLLLPLVGRVCQLSSVV